MSEDDSVIIPPEERAVREPEERPLVDMGDGNLGYEFTNSGDSINASRLLFEDSSDDPERAKAIFVATKAKDPKKKTESIFRLIRDENGDGMLQDADLSSEREAFGVIQGHRLEDPDLLDDIKIEVGKPFVFGSFTTPPVIKISVLIDNMEVPVSKERMGELTEGRTSDVLAKWESESHPQPESQS